MQLIFFFECFLNKNLITHISPNSQAVHVSKVSDCQMLYFNIFYSKKERCTEQRIKKGVCSVCQVIMSK